MPARRGRWLWIGLLAAVWTSPLIADEQARGLGEPSRRFQAPRSEGRPAGALSLGMVVAPDDAHLKSRIRGASLAIDQINAGGGCRGEPLRLLRGRVKGPWSSAAETARDMLFDAGCVALITPPDRAVSHLMEQMAFRGHVPLVSLSSAPSLTRAPIPWAVRIVPDQRAEMEALIGALEERPRTSIPAVIPSGKEGERIRKDLVAVGSRCGVVFDPVIEMERSSGLERLTPLRGEEAGPLVLWLTGERAVDALGSIASSGWKGPVLLPREYFEGGGKGAVPTDGPPCLAVRIFRPDGEEGAVARFVSAYREAFGVEPDEAAASAYDAVSVIAEAIRRTGTDRGAIRDWLATLDAYKGVTGKIRFDGTGNRCRDLSVMIIDRGRESVARPSARLPKGGREVVRSLSP